MKRYPTSWSFWMTFCCFRHSGTFGIRSSCQLSHIPLPLPLSPSVQHFASPSSPPPRSKDVICLCGHIAAIQNSLRSPTRWVYLGGGSRLLQRKRRKHATDRKSAMGDFQITARSISYYVLYAHYTNKRIFCFLVALGERRRHNNIFILNGPSCCC